MWWGTLGDYAMTVKIEASASADERTVVNIMHWLAPDRVHVQSTPLDKRPISRSPTMGGWRQSEGKGYSGFLETLRAVADR